MNARFFRTALSALLPLLLLAAVGLAGCGGGGGDSSPSPTNEQLHSRSDAQLQTLAEAALSDAETGESTTITPATIDGSNAQTVGAEASAAIAAASADAQTSGGGTAPLSTSGSGSLEGVVATALQSALPRLAVQATTQPLATQTVSGSYPCTTGNVSYSGTVSYDAVGTETSGTVTIRVDNLQLDFNGCDTGAYTVYGSILFNIDDVFIVSQSGDIVSFSIAFDHYMDGALVLVGAENYQLTFREVYVGTIAGSVNTNTSDFTFTTINIRAEITVNDYTCTGTVQNALDNISYVCSGP